MNKCFNVFIFFVVMLFVLSGCNSDIIRTPIYEGKPLTIGILGNSPVIREENVSFKSISLDQLKDIDSSSGYDAIFITEENLSQAADPIYAKTYQTAEVPFFFIESKKSYLPFIDEKRSYDEFPDLGTGNYVSGYFQKNENFQYWGYGLYNDELNSSNIKEVYTKIFETIDQIETELN